MQQKTDILFFSYGNASLASTWSNVPFLFSKTLEEKGVRVERVQLYHQNKLEEVLFNRVIRYFGKYKDRSRLYGYFRTPWARRRMEKIIRRAAEGHPKAKLCIFTNFDFCNKWTPAPSLLFGDWTYQSLLARESVRPGKADLQFIEEQHRSIAKADYVVSLFTLCTQAIKEECPESNVCHLGINVVNNMSGAEPSADVIQTKKESNLILFIGNSRYREGAVRVVEALRGMQGKYSFHVIGMTREEMGVSDSFVTCHGYLNKGDADECALYYNLLKNACVVVNPSPNWAGYSSIIEAMYFYTPVVISPMKDFVDEFGNAIPFGKYTASDSEEEVRTALSKVLGKDAPAYEQMCFSAHDAVKKYTWSNYVDRLLELVDRK